MASRVLPAEAVSWWEDSTGTTFEQAVPFGPLLAVYGPDGRLIERPYVRTWEAVTGLRPVTSAGGAA